ncbi:hypothetical protein ACIBG6_31005 [Streptomyces sp. NPDC050842]|uniref:hypothetical protein n=1 Tax=Streptomyces sp. NPDC050842 TaxID=3365636 RepID=UPI0037A938E0
MDPLQRAGAVALIESGFASVDGIDGPDGMEVELLDTIVGVCPGGALLKVFVYAEALEFAEDAVRDAVSEVLRRSELLADWKVERCEVELHPELTQESLAAADGPDGPPADPAARKARHAEPPAAAEGGEYDAQAKAEEVRARMLVLADELRSFSPVMFGVQDDPGEEDGDDYGFAVAPEDATLAAGALIYATDVLIDELFEDVHTLEQEGTNVSECDGPLWHLEDLPERYVLQYDARFARRFLVTVIAMTTRFTNGSFDQLSCVAEELALRLLLSQTTVTLELFGLLDDGVSNAKCSPTTSTRTWTTSGCTTVRWTGSTRARWARPSASHPWRSAPGSHHSTPVGTCTHRLQTNRTRPPQRDPHPHGHTRRCCR